MKGQKHEAVLVLCCRHGSAKGIAESYGTTRASLYKWIGGAVGYQVLEA